MTESLIERLSERLAGSLPGQAAQGRFAPELSYGRQFGPPPPDVRAAAVIVLLYGHEGEWHLPLTVRPQALPSHPGQISLPGGLVEPGESSEGAALRELAEELGVEERVQILGSLSPLFVYVSNFLVTPWVGTLAVRPHLRPSPAEVERVIEMPLACLSDTAGRDQLEVRSGSVVLRAPCWRWGDDRIWGATSMILAELGEVLRGAEGEGDGWRPSWK